MTTPFALLRLPRLALIPVFQCMEDVEIFAFCLLSKQTISIVKCLKLLSPVNIVLIEDLYTEIIFKFFSRPTVRLRFWKNSLAENSVTLECGITTWNNIGFSIAEWTKRMFDVSNCDEFEGVLLYKQPEFDDFFSIFSDHRRKIGKLIFYANCTGLFVEQVLETVRPVTSNIEYRCYTTDPFKTSKDFRKILIQKVDSMEINAPGFPTFFDLGYLLSSNAVKLVLRSVTLTQKELNEFFKLWMKKECNPLLEHLEVLPLRGDFENAILSGLDAVSIPEEKPPRLFRSSISIDDWYWKVIGGFDIKRADGKIGTITFGVGSLNFYTWP